MTAPRLPERDLIEEINRVRLEEDLSYRELAKAIGGGIAAQTLQEAIADRSKRLYDRTLFKIQRFLDNRKPKAPGRRGARTEARA